jgi:hypothetical protein
LSTAELSAISAKSNGILRDLGTNIQWIQSYVGENKIYCVYNAANEELIREHARCGGFPVNKIVRISSVIDPTTGERT